MIISCYLVYAGLADTATQALEFYGKIRTHDGKGVTIPSQIRYTYYFTQYIRSPLCREPRPPAPTYRLRHVRMHTVPNFDVVSVSSPLPSCPPLLPSTFLLVLSLSFPPIPFFLRRL